MRPIQLICLVLATCVVASLPAIARDKARPAAAKPTCARAAYPGDPVCDIGEESTSSLPMPSSRVIRQNDGGGVVVDDAVTVRGKNDFNDNRYGGVHLNNPSPNPRSQDVNGGGAVNYRF